MYFKNGVPIGYVEVLHARRNNIPYGALQNKDKTAFIHVKPEHVTAAAKESLSTIPEDLTFKLTNKPGSKSYPLCAAAWAVCYQQQPAARQKVVVDFLHWVTHEGQQPSFNSWGHSPHVATQAIATVSNGSVSAVAITVGASGYSTAPRVKIIGGGGTGAAAVATVVDGYVTAINVTSGGTGYTSPPMVSLDPPDDEPFVAPLPPELVQRVEQRLKTIQAAR